MPKKATQLKWRAKNTLSSTCAYWRQGAAWRIGNNAPRVRAVLGQPTHIEYHSGTKARVYVYQTAIPAHVVGQWLVDDMRHRSGHIHPWLYRGIYIFRRDKLSKIAFYALRENLRLML